MDGFEILSRLRTVLLQTKSFLMNEDVLLEWQPKIGTTGNGRTGTALSNLTPAEAAAFQACSLENMRIEQERIPPHCVVQHLADLIDAPAARPIATELVENS